MYGTVGFQLRFGNVGDHLVSKLSKKVEALKIGPGMDKASEKGPLVTKEHLEKIKRVSLI
ncbi:MAG: hypothetical protein CM1200mP13_15540 [Candidatus Pelagibacterales bacterium]|nr:MAG: hypothetical protein CM1200mP13_15540 [Pelagibacterales bacterium]